MFICGCRSFSHQEEEEDQNGSNIRPRPNLKKGRRSKSFITAKYKKDKNRFADRGLDKFSALLADLDKEKQQIYGEMGVEEISFIQFVYTEDSKKLKPIIIRVNEQQLEKNGLGFLKHSPKSIEGSTTTTSSPASADASSKSPNEITEGVEMTTVPQEKKAEKRLQRWRESFRIEEGRGSYYCFPAILVMILFFLAIYGRPFAILCTTIGLYLLPSLPGDGSSGRNMRKRKPSMKKDRV